MIETEYGVSTSWYSPFIAPFRWIRNRVGDIEATSNSGASNERETGNGILNVSHATKKFRKVFAVNDVSLSVSSGEIFGLLGPNGAGKSTFLNCLLGLYRLTSGTAELNGYDIVKHSSQVYRHVGVCPQQEILWADLTAEEHLLFYARLKGVEPKDEQDVVKKCLEQVELIPERRKLSKELSGGQRRRLGIAIAPVGQPAIVFLDEPTTGSPSMQITEPKGLDPNVRRNALPNPG